MAKKFTRRTYKEPTRAAKPEVNRVLRKLRQLGLILEWQMGAGHYRVIDPGTGAYLTSVAGTPSDVNWWHHVRRAVEKAGYSWEGKARKKSKYTGVNIVAQVDLEALGHAQRMARLHGEREPSIDDLEDKTFLTKVRKGYNEKESEEAIAEMAHGVESSRAHRVVSRLLYQAEQHAEEFEARARERNPKIRDGGVIHELMFISKQVAEKRGLRYWKTPESAWQTFSNLLSGTSAGMSVWVANLLEATMDEIDGLRYDPIGSKTASKTAETKIDPRSGAPIISMWDAKIIIRDVMTGDWTLRSEILSTLVPEHMSTKRFEDALAELVAEGTVEREREKKKQGGMFYRLTAVAGAETSPIEPETEPEPESASVPEQDEPESLPRLPQAQVADIIYAQLTSDYTLRTDIWDNAEALGATPRVFERALRRLTRQDLVERKRLPDGRTQYRRTEKPAVQSTEGPLAIEHDYTPPEPEPQSRSLMQALNAGTIADRYADALLSKLAEVNGTADWAQMEPILSRLDRLAGIGIEAE